MHGFKGSHATPARRAARPTVPLLFTPKSHSGHRAVVTVQWSPCNDTVVHTAAHNPREGGRMNARQGQAISRTLTLDAPHCEGATYM